MKKIFTAFLSIIFLLVCASLSFAQNNKLTADYIDLNYLGSAPSSPSASKGRVYVDNSGVVRVRLNNGTDVAILTGSIDTDDIAEGSTNLYHTTSRVRAALSAGTGISYNSTTGEISLSGGGGGVTFDAIGDAVANGTINLANYTQEITANSIAGATALKLSSTSTAAASNLQRLFEVAQSGANATSTQTTYSGYFSNTKTGTSSTNIAGYFSASGGTNNYGLIVANGRIGVGTTTPLSLLDFGPSSIALKTVTYYGSGNTFHGAGVISGATVGFYPTGGRHSFGALSTSDGTTYTEKVFVNDTRLDLTGSSQNLTFGGNGGIILGGGTTLNSGSKISFGGGINSQAIALYVNGNTKHIIGVGASQNVIGHPTGAKTSIGAISSSDGTTFNSYFDFNDNGKLDIIQGNITSSTPFINHTATPNSGGTTFQFFKSNITNTASASASTFIDLQTSSTSRFKIDLSGQITTNEANGIVHQLGYLKVGHFFDAGTGYSGIANAAMTNLDTDYAVLQEGLGATFVNGKSGTSLSFRLGNTEYGLLSSTKWDFTAATTGVAKRNPHAAKTSNYTVLTTDSGGVFTNVNALGDVTFALPAASAGLEYHFYVTDNQNLIVDANGTDTIRIAASVSASGGNLTANTVGNALTIRYVGVGQWGVFSSTGTWTVN